MPLLLAAADPLDHVLPHAVHVTLGPFELNNQMLMALVAAVLMLLIFPPLFRRPFVDAPSGPRNFFEAILEFLRVEVFRPALKENTDRFVPFLWTLFFFILFCNLLGQIPIGEIITLVNAGRPSHLGGTATGNLATTGALAICAFLAIHVSGVIQVARSLIHGTYGHHATHQEHSANGGPAHEAAHDLEHHRGDALAADVPANVAAIKDPAGHYRDDQHRRQRDPGVPETHAGAPRKGMNPAVAAMVSAPLYFWNFAPHPFRPGKEQSPFMWLPDVVVWALLLVLELIGAVIKPFALTVRLFANMIAGHIVLAALILLIPTGAVAAQIGVGIPVLTLSLLIRLLELFVAFLQAYIFVFLTTLFIASAVAPEH